jgi:hypothetical protein
MSMSPRQPVDQVADGAEAAPASASRRRFVRNVGLGAAALGAVAVTGTALSGVASAQAGAATEPPELDAADVARVEFLQSLSLAAEAVLTTAAAKTFLQPEIREDVRLYSRHHANQAETLGGLLTKDEQITAPNAKLVGEMAPRVDGAGDQTALLTVLMEFEQNLAATMLATIGEAESWIVAETVATVQPIVGQQAAALGSANDLPISQWLPAYATTDGAFAQSAYPVR